MKKKNNINFILSWKEKFGSIDIKTFSLKKVTTKTVKEENIDDKEEYLNIRDTTNQEKINNKANWSDKANKTPR